MAIPMERVLAFPHLASQPAENTMVPVSVSRLRLLFGQIEREFLVLASENMELRARLDNTAPGVTSTMLRRSETGYRGGEPEREHNVGAPSPSGATAASTSQAAQMPSRTDTEHQNLMRDDARGRRDSWRVQRGARGSSGSLSSVAGSDSGMQRNGGDHEQSSDYAFGLSPLVHSNSEYLQASPPSTSHATSPQQSLSQQLGSAISRVDARSTAAGVSDSRTAGAHHQDQFAMEYGHGRLLEVPSPDARGREKQEGRVEGSSAVSQGLAGSGSVGQSAGGERFRDRLRLRGRRLVSRVRDSSTAVTRVFRLRADEDSTAWKLRIDQCNTHNDGVWKLATSAWEGQVGCLLASASADRSAVIYSPQHRRELGVATHRGAVLSARFHPSERLLLTASGDRSCAIWCVPDAFGDGEERGDSPVGFDTNEDNGRSDGRLPGGGSFRLSLSPQGAPDRRLLRNTATLWGHLQAVTCADWLHSGGQVVTASADKTAMIFDAARGASKPLRSMVGHDGPLTWVSASRTRGIILTASKDCTARLWDTRSSRADAAQHVFQGHSNTVGVAVLAPDCAFALTGSDDATIKIWDLRAARTPLLTLKSGRHGVRDLALDQRAGLMAAALGHGTTRVYTLDGAKAGVLSREGAVQTPRFTSACAFGGDDAEFGLFTAGFDPGLVQLWQAPSCSTHPPNPTATLQASARGGDSGSFIATEPSEISPTSGLDRLDAA